MWLKITNESSYGMINCGEQQQQQQQRENGSMAFKFSHNWTFRKREALGILVVRTSMPVISFIRAQQRSGLKYSLLTQPHLGLRGATAGGFYGTFFPWLFTWMLVVSGRPDKWRERLAVDCLPVLAGCGDLTFFYYCYYLFHFHH